MWNRNLHEIGVEKVMLWWGGRISENLGKARRILEKLEESWRILEKCRDTIFTWRWL